MRSKLLLLFFFAYFFLCCLYLLERDRILKKRYAMLTVSFTGKYLNENYVKFDFSMGIVRVIFSFFSTVNDLVCVPPPYVKCPPFFQRHNYSHTLVHNSKTTRSIFLKFCQIAKNNMTVTNLK